LYEAVAVSLRNQRGQKKLLRSFFHHAQLRI
jgi:hypothetical protein